MLDISILLGIVGILLVLVISDLCIEKILREILSELKKKNDSK